MLVSGDSSCAGCATSRIVRSKDSPLSPLENTQISPSDGDSSNQANSEVIPPQEDAQPEGSTVETTDDAKPQASTEELSQKDEAQPEQIVANTTAENKEEYAAVYQSNVEQNGGAADISAEVQIAEQIQNGEQQLVKLKPKEEPVTKTEPENATQLERAGVQSIVHPADGSCEKGPPKQDAEEIVEAVAEVAVESSSNTSDMVNVILVKEVALQDSVEAVVEVVTKPLSGTSDAVNVAPGKEAALQILVEPVPDLLAESESERPTPPATKTATEGNCEKGPLEQAVGESVEALAEVAVESSSVTINVVNATPVIKVTLQDSVEAVNEVAVESSPETPAVTGTPGENAALQVSVEPYPDLVADTASESPAQAAAETAVKPEESIVESAASAEPVLKTEAEEVVQCEVQPVDNLVIEQIVEPERAADHVVEQTIKDAVEPVTPLDAEAAQDEFSDRLIKLSEALDVEPPTTEAAPEPVKDPKQSHTEEPKLKQHSDDSNISDMSQRSKEEPQSTQTQVETGNRNVCSFCEKIIEGNVKIYLSEPVVTCHPECLKCDVCAKALGDLLTSMFLHDQVVQCGGCFAKALNTRT